MDYCLSPSPQDDFSPGGLYCGVSSGHCSQVNLGEPRRAISACVFTTKETGICLRQALEGIFVKKFVTQLNFLMNVMSL